MAKHKVDITGISTNNLVTLSYENQVELFKKYANGDKKAREDLINGNLKLVLSILKKFINRTDNMDDLFQIGCIGLIKAIDNFDLSYNVRFSTYAVPMIIGEIKRFMRDANSLKVSRKIRDTAYLALKAKEKLRHEGNVEPQMFEIAQELDLPVRDIEQALDAVSDPVSLYESVYGDGEDSLLLMEQICDTKSNEINWIDNVELTDAVAVLPEIEKKIIVLRYYIGKTQMEIADELNISQAQVSRMEKSALSKIKKLID